MTRARSRSSRRAQSGGLLLALLALPALLALLALLALPALPALPAAGWSQPSEALDAALEWLILVDNADYHGAWEMTDEVFKTAMSRQDWVRRITAAKTPLGRLVARQFRSSEAASNPPGAPAGEYVVIRFDTRFQNAQHTLETVVVHREGDGRWIVSGYFIRPRR